MGEGGRQKASKLSNTGTYAPAVPTVLVIRARGEAAWGAPARRRPLTWPGCRHPCHLTYLQGTWENGRAAILMHASFFFFFFFRAERAINTAGTRTFTAVA